MFCTCTALDKKKKNHLGDAPSDFEESAVWFCHDASMHEVAAVASRVRSPFRSWIMHSDSSISQDSEFMHEQHGSFFLSRVVDGRFCGRKSCQWSYICEFVLPNTAVQSLFSLLERFRDSHFTDRITYRQSVKLIRNLEFRASSAQLYVYVWRTPWKRKMAAWSISSWCRQRRVSFESFDHFRGIKLRMAVWYPRKKRWCFTAEVSTSKQTVATEAKSLFKRSLWQRRQGPRRRRGGRWIKIHK